MGSDNFDYTYPGLVTGFEIPGAVPYSKVIYISGPYRDERGEYYVDQNIQMARAYALSVWRMGGVALCPHMNTSLFGGAEGLDDHVWLKGDLTLLGRCDAIFMINRWQISRGAKIELRYAQEHSIPALYSIEEVARFLIGS